MPQSRMPLRQRLRRAFRAANKPAFLIRSFLQTLTVAGTAVIAMRMTGLEPFVDTFLKAHGGLILKTSAVYFVFYPITFLLIRFMYAFLQGWFNWPNEPD